VIVVIVEIYMRRQQSTINNKQSLLPN